MDQNPISYHGKARQGEAILVFAAMMQESPKPPPTDDNPPLHVFNLSIGILIGKLLERKQFLPQDATAAANWIAGKDSVEEVIKLVWNV